MSRDQRASLLANDELGSNAAYSNLGGAGAEQRDDQSSGTLSSWWRHPRKRLYLIGISITALIFIIAIAIFAVASRGKRDEPIVAPSSSSSSSTGGMPASSTAADYSSSSGAPLPPYNPETPWLSPRLSNSTIPSHYELTERIDLKAFQFRGSVSITVNIVRPIDHILLHARELSYGGVTVTLDDKSVRTPAIWYYAPNQYIVLNFSSPVNYQAAAVIRMDFNAPLRTTANYATSGLFAAYYYNSTQQPVWMAATQFVRSDARRAFPCFDEPALKATFAITVQSQPEWPTVLSTMPAASRTVAEDGWVHTVFATTPRMSTAYLAISVSDYGNTTATASCSANTPAVPIRVFAPHFLLNYTTTATQLAAATMQYYCQYFGLDYPLPKQDIIPIPQLQLGGTSNWGLICVNPNQLLLDSQYYTAEQLENTAAGIAQHMALQWFGDLVTASWWTQMWLNEGFSVYAAFLGADFAAPTMYFADQFLLQIDVIAKFYDSLPTAVPVVHGSTTAGAQYAAYEKGASLMRMLQGVLGADVFQAGVQAYLKTYQFGIADGNELFVCLTDAATNAGQSINVVEFMFEWTTQPGYPLVNCTTVPAQFGGRGWTCTQERFNRYPDQSLPSSAAWTIYLTAANNYAPLNTANGLQWPATQSSYTIVVPSATPFIKLNSNSTGFYRVMYDNYGWQQLSGALNVDGFSGMHHDDRLGLIIDAYEFNSQGWMSVTDFLNLTRFLQYDTAVRKQKRTPANLTSGSRNLSRSAMLTAALCSSAVCALCAVDCVVRVSL